MLYRLCKYIHFTVKITNSNFLHLRFYSFYTPRLAYQQAFQKHAKRIPQSQCCRPKAAPIQPTGRSPGPAENFFTNRLN